MDSRGSAHPAAPAAILRLGNPRLRHPAAPVECFTEAALALDCRRLHATLADFRRSAGFGRAIAAPQIGVSRRMVALHLEDRPFTMLNPRIVWRSEDTFTLWDDCMSFPELLVRVRRHQSISVHWQDEQGRPRSFERIDRARSELLQHELDHLDGVLAVDRALDRDSLVLRTEFDSDPEYFRGLADATAWAS